MDYYLQFSDEDTMRSVFGTVSFIADGMQCTTHPLVAHMAVDIVGICYHRTGEVVKDELGMDVPVFEPLPGWLVNLRGEALPPELEQFVRHPELTEDGPAQVWA